MEGLIFGILRYLRGLTRANFKFKKRPSEKMTLKKLLTPVFA